MNNYIASIIIAVAILGSAWIVGNSMNHTAVINNGNQNSLLVSGDGKVTAKPDTFILTVMAEERTKTTKEAFENVAKKVESLKALMKANGIEDKDVQSTNIAINPNYIWTDNKSTIDGFIATHGLTIKIRNLEKIDPILSGVSAIDGVQIQNTVYDIDDKTELYKQARDLAIQKARQKAEDMAKASGTSLGKVVSLSESQGYTPPLYNNQFMAVKNEVAMDASAGGGVSVGQLEITTTVNMSYELR
jgi:uncharacterized protein YggE